jgi:hypothetical protein
MTIYKSKIVVLEQKVHFLYFGSNILSFTHVDTGMSSNKSFTEECLYPYVFTAA